VVQFVSIRGRECPVALTLVVSAINSCYVLETRRDHTGPSGSELQGISFLSFSFLGVNFKVVACSHLTSCGKEQYRSHFQLSLYPPNETLKMSCHGVLKGDLSGDTFL
jgi:hypothetical protein